MDKFERFSKKWLKVLFLMDLCLCLPAAQGFSAPPPVTHAPAASEPALTAWDFTVSPITPDIEARIRGRSYPENCPIPLDSLRYLTVLHTGFDGLTHRGELIVNREIAEITLEIFYRLYLLGYPIEKITLIDEYNADDETSMADNNTSAFCYRPIAGTNTLSLHSYGLAIDINPLYNPYVHGETVAPAASPYDKAAGTVPSPYFMTETDPCVQLFQAFGFVWGGSWDSPTDYQHFEYTIAASH